MNNKVIRITISTFLTLLIIISGVFCYQGLQVMNSHCSGEVTSVWCSDFLSHGTIVSEAILTTIFVVLLGLVTIIFIKPITNLLRSLRQRVLYVPKVKYRLQTLSPIQLAISNGIIHSRIP